jgi:aminoglycoside 3-N-acetyltransferase
MQEEAFPQEITDPVTKKQLIDTFHQLGIGKSAILEVHSKLSSFHYVIGGARTVVDALMETVGEGGTLLMPMQCGDNSEPSDWSNPPIAPEIYKEIRESIPPFDAKTSDLRKMGAVVENFVHRPGVVVSNHPSVSYAAWGRYAKLLCNRQSMHFPLAEESPTARLYELKGNVLLIGTDFDTCTCMHLAEYKCDARPIEVMGACVAGENGNEWKKYLDLALDSDEFLKIKPLLSRRRKLHEASLGGSRIMYFSSADAVDEACRYFEKTCVYDLYR